MKLSQEVETQIEPGPIDRASVPILSTVLSQEKATLGAKEAEVGIINYVSTGTSGFQGNLKKRYTDFLVNEILPNGKVVHLQVLGSITVSRHDSTHGVEVSSERNGAGNSSLDASDPSSLKLPSATTTVTSRTERGKLERSEDPPTGDGSSLVGPLTSNWKYKLTFDEVSADDIAKLITYLDVKATEELLALYKKTLASPNTRPRDHGFVTTSIPTEKTVRTTLHEDIRRIFRSQIDSSTDKERGLMTFSAAAPHNNKSSTQGTVRGKQMRRQGKLGWADHGGEFLHFSLYKENKDTMEVISFLTRQLNVNAKAFQFAGTKDRRAVTVQRVSAYRVEGHRLASQNRLLRNAAIGDFEYQQHGLELGDLKGNEFLITLRECQWEKTQSLPIEEKISAAEQAMSLACRNLHEKGFFNFYGLQRFGTFATRTDVVGVKLLQGHFQGACEAILHYNPSVLAAAQDPDSTEQIGSDDKARAEAIHTFQESGRANEALGKLPRKFSAEGNIVRHLGKSSRDYFGAIQTIQRNLRLMYVHAYQSLVWNFAVCERWKLFGDRVVEGDLVLTNEHKQKELGAVIAPEEVDADGEVVIQATGEDRAQGVDDVFERARALTASEAASGKYSIFDIVLPLPGFDVLYPNNAMMDFYKTFMGSERGGGLDPLNMRRKHKDLSLSGGYRKVLARIESGYDVQVRAYCDDNEQFVETDMEVIKRHSSGKQSPAAASQVSKEADKIAVILNMQLGSSQYATMALRELSKSGIQAYKPDFGGGR
jgi:tRNA pseudouridine13 synthase